MITWTKYPVIVNSSPYSYYWDAYNGSQWVGAVFLKKSDGRYVPFCDNDLMGTYPSLRTLGKAKALLAMKFFSFRKYA